MGASDPAFGQLPARAWSPFRQDPGYLSRDRIIVLGRRGAGKTIFLARLYEALWNGCTLVDGRMQADSGRVRKGQVSRLSCRALTGAADMAFMRTIAELKEGRWPAATVGNTYAELEVAHNGRVHQVTTIDYPGEVFRKTFMLDSEEPDAVELRSAIDRAAGVILLIDPSVSGASVEESREDVFGMTQAVTRIRSSTGGSEVPVAVVFTKCDRNEHFLREAGGPVEFAKTRFRQLFKEVQRTRIFPCAAVAVRTGSRGRPVPVVRSSPLNVVEPLLYCIQQIESARSVSESFDRKYMAEREYRVEAESERRERDRSVKTWWLFAMAVMALMAVAVVGTLIYIRK